MTGDSAGNTTGSHRAKILDLFKNDVLFCGTPYNRSRKRMFAALFQRGGQPQQLLGRKPVVGQDIDELGFTLGERPRLIDDERGEFFQPFERLSILPAPLPAPRVRPRP